MKCQCKFAKFIIVAVVIVAIAAVGYVAFADVHVAPRRHRKAGIAAAKIETALARLPEIKLHIRRGERRQAFSKLSLLEDELKSAHRTLTIIRQKVINSRCPVKGKHIDPLNVPDHLYRKHDTHGVGLCSRDCADLWDIMSDDMRTARLAAVTQQMIHYNVVNKRCPFHQRNAIDPTKLSRKLYRTHENHGVGLCSHDCANKWDRLTYTQRTEVLRSALKPVKLTVVNHYCPINHWKINPKSIPFKHYRTHRDKGIGFCHEDCATEWDTHSLKRRDLLLKRALMLKTLPRVVNHYCPVAGTQIDPRNIEDHLIRTHRGESVGFCSRRCTLIWELLSDQLRDFRVRVYRNKK